MDSIDKKPLGEQSKMPSRLLLRLSYAIRLGGGRSPSVGELPYEEAAVDRIVDLCNRSHRETMRLIEIEGAWSRELEEWAQANGCSRMETAQ
jgi:hypothetical protein